MNTGSDIETEQAVSEQAMSEQAMSEQAVLESLAEELATAERTRVAVAPIALRHPDLDRRHAYSIARINVDRRLAAGARLTGHKVGLTSAAMQAMLGVDEPDYGALFDDMFLGSEATVAADRWIRPRVEPEIAFRLAADLSGPGVTAADVLAVTEAVAPALEIIDSRIEGWRITLVDTIADNASSAAVVLGDWVPLDRAPDLAGVTGVLSVNGTEVDRGLGSAVLGHPATAVAWLINTLADLGTTIEAGAVIMPGSVTRAVDIAAGDTVAADFTHLGRVTITFA